MAHRVIQDSAALCAAVREGESREAFDVAYAATIRRWDLAAKHGLLRKMLLDDHEVGSMDLHYLVDEGRLKAAEESGMGDLVSLIREDREEFYNSPETCYKGNVVRAYWEELSK